jgi:hypothetical protein
VSTTTTTHASPRRAPSTGDNAAVAALVLVFVAVVGAVGLQSTTIAAGALALAFVVLTIRAIESWQTLLTALLLLIFLVPIKRYKLPVDLPFDLEPYRLAVLGLVLIFLGALLVDPRVRLHRTALDAPVLVLLVAVLASISVNVAFIVELGVVTDAVKAVSFFTSFLLVYVMVATVVVTRSQVERLLRLIVGLAAVISVFAVIEYHSGFNIFNHISKLIPVLNYEGDLGLAGITRSDRLRVYGPAQHPIALAALLAMLLPLALYVAQTTKRRMWWVAVFLVGLGALSALSRTGVIALIAGGIALLILRPFETKRLVPVLLPALVLVFFALPNALGTFKSTFFPQGGIVAEQTALEPNNQLYGNGRLADIGPTLHQWRQRPIFGRGYGSRIVEIGPRQNSAILDDQWLGFLLETGLLGVGALAWTVERAVRRLGRMARRDPSDLGLLAGSIAASLVSFVVGIFTYDAFGFIQVTLVWFILLAIGGAVISLGESRARPT